MDTTNSFNDNFKDRLTADCCGLTNFSNISNYPILKIRFGNDRKLHIVIDTINTIILNRITNYALLKSHDKNPARY
jgi:hypothetical protein